MQKGSFANTQKGPTVLIEAEENKKQEMNDVFFQSGFQECWVSPATTLGMTSIYYALLLLLLFFLKPLGYRKEKLVY